MKKTDCQNQWEIDLIHPVSKTKVGYHPQKNEEVNPKDLWEIHDHDMGNPLMIDTDSNLLLMGDDELYLSREIADRLGAWVQREKPDLKVGRMGFFNFGDRFDEMFEYNDHPPRNIHEKLVRDRNLQVLEAVLELLPDSSPPLDSIGWKEDIGGLIQNMEDRLSGEPVDLGFDPDRAMGFIPGKLSPGSPGYDQSYEVPDSWGT